MKKFFQKYRKCSEYDDDILNDSRDYYFFKAAVAAVVIVGGLLYGVFRIVQHFNN